MISILKPTKIWLFRLLQLSFFLAFSSCSSLYTRDSKDLLIQIPTSFKSSDDFQDNSPVADHWWLAYADENLEDFINEVLSQNLELQQALARIEAAYTNSSIAGSRLFPQLALDTSGNRRKQVFVGLPIPGSESGVLETISESYSAQAFLSWEIDLWGKIRAQKQGARYLAEETEYLANSLGLFLIGQTLKYYGDLALSNTLLEISERRVDLSHRLRSYHQSRYKLGLDNSNPLLLAESFALKASADQEVILRQRESLLKLLEILAARYPKGEDFLQAKIPEIEKGIPLGVAAELIARRPDLLASEKKLLASNEKIKENFASLFPNISLTASGGYSSNTLKDILNGNFALWSLGARVLQPIFQGGSIVQSIKVAEIEADQALIDFAKNTLQAFYEVETALENENSLILELFDYQDRFSSQEKLFRRQRVDINLAR